MTIMFFSYLLASEFYKTDFSTKIFQENFRVFGCGHKKTRRESRVVDVTYGAKMNVDEIYGVFLSSFNMCPCCVGQLCVR